MSKSSHHERAIEFLARESQVPVDEVARLYDHARAELEAGARIRGFLGIFAIRNVRRVLRQRKLQASALALCIAFAGCADVADARLLSSTGPVIAVLDGELPAKPPPLPT